MSYIRSQSKKSPGYQRTNICCPLGNTRGTYVTQVSATDDDEGSNGRITYSIIGGNSQNAFVIDPPNTGIVKTNIILDREIKDSYRFVHFFLNTESYILFTLTETDSDTDSDSHSKPNGHIVLCRTCSHCTDSDSDPYSLFVHRTRI